MSPVRPPERRGAEAARLGAVEVAVTVSVAALRGDAGGYLPTEPEAALDEQLRQIKRPLVAKAFGSTGERVEKGHVIMITSSVAGEGKTFCSLNLALSMAAEREYDVLLIDADLINQKLTTLLGLEQRYGLADVVRDGTDKTAATIAATDVPGLFVIGAGRRHGQEAELMVSTRMQDVVAHFASAFRDALVLIDSAPLCETSGARTLAASVGQIALVVRAGVTPRKTVLTALELLAGIEPVNLILNQATGKQAPAYGSAYQSATARPAARLEFQPRPGESDLL